jgi:hypothetical protein
VVACPDLQGFLARVEQSNDGALSALANAFVSTAFAVVPPAALNEAFRLEVDPELLEGLDRRSAGSLEA